MESRRLNQPEATGARGRNQPAGPKQFGTVYVQPVDFVGEGGDMRMRVRPLAGRRDLPEEFEVSLRREPGKNEKAPAILSFKTGAKYSQLKLPNLAAARLVLDKVVVDAAGNYSALWISTLVKELGPKDVSAANEAISLRQYRATYKDSAVRVMEATVIRPAQAVEVKAFEDLKAAIVAAAMNFEHGVPDGNRGVLLRRITGDGSSEAEASTDILEFTYRRSAKADERGTPISPEEMADAMLSRPTEGEAQRLGATMGEIFQGDFEAGGVRILVAPACRMVLGQVTAQECEQHAFRRGIMANGHSGFFARAAYVARAPEREGTSGYLSNVNAGGFEAVPTSGVGIAGDWRAKQRLDAAARLEQAPSPTPVAAPTPSPAPNPAEPVSADQDGDLVDVAAALEAVRETDPAVGF